MLIGSKYLHLTPANPSFTLPYPWHPVLHLIPVTPSTPVLSVFPSLILSLCPHPIPGHLTSPINPFYCCSNRYSHSFICIFSVNIHWHVFGDDKSLNFAQKALDQGFSSLPYDRRQKFSSEIDLHDLDEVEKKISAQVEILMKYFTGTIC